jgi:hypothetical protein
MTPLILLVAVVVPMVRMLEDMTLVVATTPLTVVVAMLLAILRELVVLEAINDAMLPMDALVMVVVARVEIPVTVRVPFDDKVEVAMREPMVPDPAVSTCNIRDCPASKEGIDVVARMPLTLEFNIPLIPPST